jgi:hypothetical protein
MQKKLYHAVVNANCVVASASNWARGHIEAVSTASATSWLKKKSNFSSVHLKTCIIMVIVKYYIFHDSAKISASKMIYYFALTGYTEITSTVLDFALGIPC